MRKFGFLILIAIALLLNCKKDIQIPVFCHINYSSNLGNIQYDGSNRLVATSVDSFVYYANYIREYPEKIDKLSYTDFFYNEDENIIVKAHVQFDVANEIIGADTIWYFYENSYLISSYEKYYFIDSFATTITDNMTRYSYSLDGQPLTDSIFLGTSNTCLSVNYYQWYDTVDVQSFQDFPYLLPVRHYDYLLNMVTSYHPSDSIYSLHERTYSYTIDANYCITNTFVHHRIWVSLSFLYYDYSSWYNWDCAYY